MDDKKTQARKDFIRIAERRVGNTLNLIRLIGNLSNTTNYSYTERDVDKIFNTIEAELADCRKRFNAKQKTKPKFTLEIDDLSNLD